MATKFPWVDMSNRSISPRAKARPALRMCLSEVPALFSEGLEEETTSEPVSVSESVRFRFARTFRLAKTWPAILDLLTGRARQAQPDEQHA